MNVVLLVLFGAIFTGLVVWQDRKVREMHKARALALISSWAAAIGSYLLFVAMLIVEILP